MNRFFAGVIFCLVIFLAEICYGADKKIIYSGWDSPDTQFIRDNWQAMEKSPLDGTGIRVAMDRSAAKQGNWDVGSWVTSSRELKLEDYREAINDMKSVKWQRFTNNFLVLPMSHSLTKGLHWFDDARWDLFLKNLEVLTRLSREMQIKGLIIDVEDYGYELFSYQFMNKEYHAADFQEYQKKAYERGMQAMKAINKIRPDVTLLFYYAWSLPVNDLMIKIPLEKQRYALLPSFMDGMLKASSEGTTFHEGFEYSYGYRKNEDFQRAKKLIIEEGRKLTRSSEKFDRQVKMGFGLWLDNSARWYQEQPLRNYFSPEDWEKSLSYALSSSDRYVWIYSHNARFFHSPNIPQSYFSVMEKVKEETCRIQTKKSSKKSSYSGFVALELTVRKYVTDNPAENEENTFKDLWEKYEFIGNLPGKWKFKLDPQTEGVKKRWFKQTLQQSAEIEIGRWWEEQGYSYDGDAWYQTEFKIPKELKGRKVFLAFGAVDETAEVYINGILAGEHKVDPNVGWNQRFLIDITPHLKYGKKNMVTVRVYDSSRYGGIWKAVKLVAEKKN